MTEIIKRMIGSPWGVLVAEKLKNNPLIEIICCWVLRKESKRLGKLFRRPSTARANEKKTILQRVPIIVGRSINLHLYSSYKYKSAMRHLSCGCSSYGYEN